MTDPLADWLRAALDSDEVPRLERLAGGNSNETFAVHCGEEQFILRRPPGVAGDKSAHNVEREYRILLALTHTHVPVPRPVAVANDVGDGRGAALLMERVEGVSLTERLPGDFPDDGVARVGYATVEALADLHALDWQELGLADFGRPDGFLERQTRRWRRQYEQYRHRDLPDFDAVADWLDANRPETQVAGIIHGDFHVDNCLFSLAEPGRLSAIIDWEMATIGDPLLDLGLMLAFWGERAGPPAMPLVQGFSRVGDTPTRDQLAARYAARSGLSIDALGYYMALALWKLAAIVEGAHLHYLAGRVDSRYAADLEQDVPRLLAEARLHAGIDG